MDKDKLELGFALFEGLLEPVVLRLAECPTPEVAALPAGRGPVGVECDEECIAPVEGVVILELAGV